LPVPPSSIIWYRCKLVTVRLASHLPGVTTDNSRARYHFSTYLPFAFEKKMSTPVYGPLAMAHFTFYTWCKNGNPLPYLRLHYELAPTNRTVIKIRLNKNNDIQLILFIRSI